MTTFCLDDLREDELVPCTSCLGLFHPLVLDGNFDCESCGKEGTNGAAGSTH
jgi:hypothetical protein